MRIVTRETEAKRIADLTTESLVEQMRSVEWYVKTWYPSEIAKTTHARRLASLKRGKVEAEETLSQMVTEYSSRLQEV